MADIPPVKPALRGVDVGIQLFVSVLLCGTVGYALDTWLDCKPLGMLVGGLLGFGAWLWGVWKMLQGVKE